MKPDTRTAMVQLIGQIREAVPFNLSEAEICSGTCQGCARKLLDFLDQELAQWDSFLAQGGKPKLGDISKLAKTSRKIYRAMEKNNLV